MRNIFISIALILNLTVNSQTKIKVMFYNLLNYPTAPPNNRGQILKKILNTYEPDIFMVFELEDNNTAYDIFIHFIIGN